MMCARLPPFSFPSAIMICRTISCRPDQQNQDPPSLELQEINITVRRYICQIALSGALEFIQKYEGDTEDAAKDGIIGHFGLGFYSAFMVSDTVDVITRSYKSDNAVKWVCSEAGEYEGSNDHQCSVVGRSDWKDELG